jgi:hypothetical protein
MILSCRGNECEGQCVVGCVNICVIGRCSEKWKRIRVTGVCLLYYYDLIHFLTFKNRASYI